MDDKPLKLIAIIPARGGSKGVPRKNARLLAGKPLVAHTIEQARQAICVTRVVVSTDDPEIGAISAEYGAEVVWRPAELSGDTATSESALRHALDQLQQVEGYEPDLVLFLQCTAPLRQPDDIDRAVQKLREEEADSLFSAVPFHRFLWRREGDDGAPRSFNYDHQHRPRRQDRAPEYLENGSIYIFKPWVLERYDNRLGGKIAIYEMDEASAVDIDTPQDFEWCELLLVERQRQQRLAKLPPDVVLLALDFDGVLTDNRVWVNQDGVESVACHRGDGWGLRLLRQHGVEVVVLSTESNPVVSARCRKMDIPCQQGLGHNKGDAFRALLAERQLDPAQVIFVGNDLNDLECLRLAGCAVVVADAHPAVLAEADLVLTEKGGHGAVRELCDLLIAATMKM